MNIEDLRTYCLTVKGSSEGFPFGKDILVFKIMEKMFAYIGLNPKDGLFFVNLKCDSGRSIDLRERYEGVKRGHHTTGMMWNSVYIESDIPDDVIKELIDHSVEEVINKLPKKKQEEYKNMP